VTWPQTRWASLSPRCSTRQACRVKTVSLPLRVREQCARRAVVTNHSVTDCAADGRHSCSVSRAARLDHCAWCGIRCARPEIGARWRILRRILSQRRGRRCCTAATESASRCVNRARACIVLALTELAPEAPRLPLTRYGPRCSRARAGRADVGCRAIRHGRGSRGRARGRCPDADASDRTGAQWLEMSHSNAARASGALLLARKSIERIERGATPERTSRWHGIH